MRSSGSLLVAIELDSHVSRYSARTHHALVFRGVIKVDIADSGSSTVVSRSMFTVSAVLRVSATLV